MSEADLNIVKNSIKSTLNSKIKSSIMSLENKVCRDFLEIRNLQNPNTAIFPFQALVERLIFSLFSYYM